MCRFGGHIRGGGTVLDLACGAGRHSQYFAARGYSVMAVDIDVSRLGTFAAVDSIEVIQADLEQADWPFRDREFDGIVVVNYLHRPHFPLLTAALANDGVLLFDTFAAGNERHGRPSNAEFLLQPGELLREFGTTMDIVAYENGEVREREAAVRQRLCAVRR